MKLRQHPLMSAPEDQRLSGVHSQADFFGFAAVIDAGKYFNSLGRWIRLGKTFDQSIT